MSKKVFIDPGHGGSDPGAVGRGLREKDLTLFISKKVAAYLHKHFSGHSIKLSRTTDMTLSLNARTNAANHWGADLLVSIHINAGGGTGFESFMYNGSVQNATPGAQNILHANIMRHVKGWRDRGKKKQNFHMLRESKMVAVLTESGFIDTAADSKQLKSPAFLNSIAKGHAEGIAEILKLKRKKKVAPVVEENKNEPSEWAAAGWKLATSRGLVDGTRPQDNISRQEVATVANRLYDKIK